MDLSQLYEGWRNKLFPPKELKRIIQKVGKERTIICELCEYHSKHHKSIRPDDHCSICGCTLSAKTKCLSCACPVYKWREIMTSEQEEEMNNEEE
jgi:hypothetical protein